MRTFLRTAPLLAALGVAAAGHANLLVNGGFENPALGPGQYGLYSSIQGWSATPPTLIEVGRGGLYGVSGYGGLNVCELDSNGNSIVSQTFNLATATSLYVTFDYARRDGTATSTNLLSVMMNGTTYNIMPVSTTMTSATYDFNGVVGANTLTFTATGTSDSLGGIIDNVSVATPGPLAALPFALGLLKRGRRKA